MINEIRLIKEYTKLINNENKITERLRNYLILKRKLYIFFIKTYEIIK